MTTVLWDWNGTLLEDTELSVSLLNDSLVQYGYPTVTVEEYRKVFGFPIRKYYEALGVTDEDFDPMAVMWADGYAEGWHDCELQHQAAETVRRFREAGLKQVIISASKLEVLKAQVAAYPALDGMFDDILGLNDIYAHSKVQLGLDYLHQSGIDPKDCVFLGDTTHDAEVAAAIGCRCILVSGGHQADEVLRSAGVEVASSLRHAAEMMGIA
ncbi:MAG: HAD hydrolase-like protein [Clostridia bacterium]|nr:HAD hydrolase-like protein [Clostridia bacterium]